MVAALRLPQFFDHTCSAFLNATGVILIVIHNHRKPLFLFLDPFVILNKYLSSVSHACLQI